MTDTFETYNTFDTVLREFEDANNLSLSDYSWILEQFDAIPWHEVYHTLKYRHESERVTLNFDHYFQTIEIAFDGRIVARSFEAYEGWVRKSVTWTNKEDYDGDN